MAAIDYLKNFLRNEGFRFEETENLISFKVQGNNYLAFKNKSSYLQITTIWGYECDRHKALEICNELNNDRYIVKCVIVNDSLWCSWEFLPTEQTTSDNFMSIFNLLESTVRQFFEKSNE